MTLELTSAERSALRARAHALRAQIIIGAAGLTTPVLDEINKNLARRELCKIRVFSDDHAGRAKLLADICASLNAAPVQHIGKILVLYRPRPQTTNQSHHKPKPGRKPSRRTKRSFQ